MLRFEICLIISGLIVTELYCDENFESGGRTVEVTNGVLRGTKRGNIYCFEGIPYAEPPIGELRFEPPRAFLEKWNGIRNSTRPGEQCVQYNQFKPGPDHVHGSEDCLFLNVHTLDTTPEVKFPVVVFIHSGGFTYGYGDFYEPTILLQRDIVLVTLNYRLGPLGFLTTADEHLPGNMGLKDQVLALKWVHENIHNFGGDKTKITISGYSAGGASVHLHYMSPLSRGLFQSGISHSGVALNPWVFPDKPVERTHGLAISLNCSVDSSEVLKACLKMKAANDIVRGVGQFQPWLFNPFTIFGPVVEPESPTAFITKTPLQYIQKGELELKPWLVTFCKDEGIFPAAYFVKDEESLLELDRRWSEIAPFIMDYNETVSDEQLNEVSQTIRDFYFQDLPIQEATFDRVIQMISDRHFNVGIQKAVKLQSQNIRAPIFLYLFEFAAKYGLGQKMSDSDKELGVGHGDDVLLIFENRMRKPPHGYNSEEARMQCVLLDIYESFLATGSPKIGNDTQIESVQLKGSEFTYFDIINPDTFGPKWTSDVANETFWDSVVPYF